MGRYELEPYRDEDDKAGRTKEERIAYLRGRIHDLEKQAQNLRDLITELLNE